MTRRRRRAAALLLLAVAALAPARPARALLPQANASGEALYQRECAPCHGPAGHGDGPEAPTFRTQPRDLGDLARAPLSPRIVERLRRSRLRMLEIDEEVVVERRKRMVEELVGYLERMPDVPWPQVHRGADVYAERCEKCHGPNGRPVTVNVLQRGPRPTGAQPRPDFQKAHGADELLALAHGQGHAAVPGFAPVMNEQDAQALLAYLRLLSNGFVWYSLWCAGCHGDEGRGDGLLATGIDRPNVVFDRTWLAAQSPAELRRKAMHLFSDVEPTAPHFARNVSEGQARALLAALRALQEAEGSATPLPAVSGVARAAGGTPLRSVVAAPAATVASAATPATTPAPPGFEQRLQRQPSSAAPTAPIVPAQTPAPTAVRVATTPAPSPSLRPAAQATPRKPAAAKAVKPNAAKPAVKSKSQVKPTVKPKAKPTPVKKPASRATARPTPEPPVELERPAPEHVIEVPL